MFKFQISTWDTISRFLCVSCVAAASGGNDPEASSDVGGYLTPRSIETPVGGSGHHLTQVSHLTKSSSAYPETGFSSSTHQIRDPYASRLPPNLRASNKSTKSDGDEQTLHTQAEHQHHTHKSHQAQSQNLHHHHQHHHHHHHNHRHQKCKEPQQQNNSLQQVSDQDKAESDNDDNSIYTILIRFPPASGTIESSKSSSKQRHKGTAKNGGTYSTNNITNNLQRSKSVHDAGHLESNQLSHRIPIGTSIQMLLESPDDENTPMVRTEMTSSAKFGGKEKSINSKSAYSKSLPARTRNANKGGGGGSGTSGTTNSSSQRSSHSTTQTTSTDTPATLKCCKNQTPVSNVDGDISKLPLDARLVPKQLLKVKKVLLIQLNIYESLTFKLELCLIVMFL